jgi:hypothetical protein
MNTKDRRMLLGSVALAALCWLVSPLAARKEPVREISPESSLRFDGQRAFDLARDYVTRYPQRVLGSIESRQSTGLFKDYLASAGYDVQYMHFDAVIESQVQVGRNVLALRKGETPQVLVVAAHYDTGRTTVQGASDNGVGVAVMLELARIFSSESPRHSILFVATDGEEWGSLGAADLARHYPERRNIATVLTLDGVAPGALSQFWMAPTGLMTGYSPPWLRSLSAHAAGSSGLPVTEPTGLEEHIDRTFEVPGSDQGAFLASGFPAINLGSFPQDPTEYWATIHSAGDTIDKIRVESVQAFGRAAETLLRSLDALPGIPDESMSAFEVVRGRFLAPIVVKLLHILVFLPFLVLLRTHWRKYNDSLEIEPVRWEALSLLETWGPFLAGYGAILLCARLEFLPLFNLFPPPPQDPVAQNPSWGAVAAIFLMALTTAAILYLLGWFLTRKIRRPDFNASKLILLMMLLVVVVFALLYNSYWAVSFIALPALIWPLISPARAAGARAANILFVLAAGLPFYVAQLGFAGLTGLGWGTIWYQTLALNGGLFTFGGFCLASATAALAIRFVAIQFSPSSDR